MKAKLYLVLLLVFLLAIASCQDSDNPVQSSDQSSQISDLTKTTDPNIIPGEYIIVLNDDVSRVPDVANEMAKLHTATIGHVYQYSIKGFSARMSSVAAEKMLKNPNVKFIEPNKIIMLRPPSDKPGKPPKDEDPPEETNQITPWGITRVGGPANGTGKTAWVIDTGIDLDHPDLNVDVIRSASFVLRSTSADDDNGHGTHVAGTIAAINNNSGVVGVAAGATVVPVKVLDRRGSGTLSGVIAGVDYVAGNASNDDVANMSLGGGVSTALDNAVLAASSSCPFSLAAGNEYDDANNHSPARVNGPNIYTVSAFDRNDNWASFSNYGNPPIDYAAPGVSILSLYKNGGAATMSGTSMAAPHVAGLLLLGNISSDGTVKGDPDGNADPIAHY